MKLEHRTDIQALYDLSSLCNDDLEVVAVLLLLPKIKPTKKILDDLSMLRLTKYESDINYLLDNLTTGTIKNLCHIYQEAKAKSDVMG